MQIIKTGARCAALMLTLTLAACGGGGAADESPSAAASLTSEASAQAPDTLALGASADAAPAAAPTPVEMAVGAAPTLAARAETGSDNASAMSLLQLRPLHSLKDAAEVEPMAAMAGSAGYTPQDLRQAYAFPQLPANLDTASAAQKAALGLGQTIYIVVAYHEPAVLSYLNIAAQRFGLPTCTQAVIDNRTAMPLAAAPTTGCVFSVVGADASGNVAALPGVNIRWGDEEALDTQLIHAAAPLARIVVVAAQAADAQSLGGAIRLANKMGNGVVSMSFGAGDRAAFGMMDPLFQAAGMAYVASTGDAGYNNGTTTWPAAVPTVLAVGGTSLSWDGKTRTEQAWSLGGGGASTWRAAPAYQKGYNVTSSRGEIVTTTRMLPDVSLNADANTGYLVYALGPMGPAWFKAGGTSASAPIWGGLVAAGNAMRKANKKAAMTSVHQVLYRTVGMTAPTYQGNIFDVTTGSNGSCATCTAARGFDLATGLGTPNVSSLLSTFAAN